jgi:hypothetical protein
LPRRSFMIIVCNSQLHLFVHFRRSGGARFARCFACRDLPRQQVSEEKTKRDKKRQKEEEKPRFPSVKPLLVVSCKGCLMHFVRLFRDHHDENEYEIMPRQAQDKRNNDALNSGACWCGGRDGDIYMANRLQEELARLGVCMLPRTPHPDLSLSVAFTIPINNHSRNHNQRQS